MSNYGDSERKACIGASYDLKMPDTHGFRPCRPEACNPEVCMQEAAADNNADKSNGSPSVVATEPAAVTTAAATTPATTPAESANLAPAPMATNAAEKESKQEGIAMKGESQKSGRRVVRLLVLLAIAVVCYYAYTQKKIKKAKTIDTEILPLRKARTLARRYVRRK